MTQLTKILIAQWLEHLTDITQVITTWNSEVFPVVPCPVAKEPSFRENNIIFILRFA